MTYTRIYNHYTGEEFQTALLEYYLKELGLPDELIDKVFSEFNDFLKKVKDDGAVFFRDRDDFREAAREELSDELRYSDDDDDDEEDWSISQYEAYNHGKKVGYKEGYAKGKYDGSVSGFTLPGDTRSGDADDDPIDL